nr:Fc receptor-like A isoform X10 [Peromyscus maniculatus bairdii]
MKLSCVLMTWALYVCPAVLLATQMLPAASSETLKCEGPFSMDQSSCHTEEEEEEEEAADVTHSSDTDFQVKGYKFSKPFHLIVSYELFPSPVLKALPSSEPQEGGSVTLSCQTKLSLQRSASRLLFSFYKDGRPLSIRGVSSELQIPKASEEHSGSYWCEAATEDRQVWKQSPQLEIRVQGPLNSADSSVLNPALQKSTASETSPAEPADPLAPPPAPSAEPLGFSSADPHLYHQIRLLLKQMQDVKVLLGHLVMELRDLTVYLKPGVTNAADK